VQNSLKGEPTATLKNGGGANASFVSPNIHSLLLGIRHGSAKTTDLWFWVKMVKGTLVCWSKKLLLILSR